MKTPELNYLKSQIYTEHGTKYRIIAKVSLTDYYNTGIYCFRVTVDIYEKRKNGRFYWYTGGCCHKEIERHLPELAKFIPLHLCNHYGAPTLPEENGFYHLQNSGKDVTMNYLRITENEYASLSLAEDKEYFKYLLFSLGIVDRWKKEADTLISELETLCGLKWGNPYNPEEERFTLTLSDEERARIDKLIKEGFYAKENIEKRKEEARKSALIKKRAELCERYDKEIMETEREKQVMLYILDSGVSIDNVKYQANTVYFNWRPYENKVSYEDFNEFLKKVDYSELPEGINFEIM